MPCLGGCYLCERLLDTLLPLIPLYDSKVEACVRLIEAMSDCGCGPLREVCGKVIAFDEAYGGAHPEEVEG